MPATLTSLKPLTPRKPRTPAPSHEAPHRLPEALLGGRAGAGRRGGGRPVDWRALTAAEAWAYVPYEVYDREVRARAARAPTPTPDGPDGVERGGPGRETPAHRRIGPVACGGGDAFRIFAYPQE